MNVWPVDYALNVLTSKFFFQLFPSRLAKCDVSSIQSKTHKAMCLVSFDRKQKWNNPETTPQSNSFSKFHKNRRRSIMQTAKCIDHTDSNGILAMHIQTRTWACYLQRSHLCEIVLRSSMCGIWCWLCVTVLLVHIQWYWAHLTECWIGSVALDTFDSCFEAKGKSALFALD